MTAIYILQTSEQDPSTSGVQFTCRAKAKSAYYDAYYNSLKKDGGFASLSKIFASNKTAIGYEQKLMLEFQTGIYNN